MAIKIASMVRNGYTQSCGCLRSAGNRRTHGQSQVNHSKPTRTYVAWLNMKARCDNTKHTGFHNYGGRGIRYCERWLSFEAFHADMGDCPANGTLEREDNSGNYEPGNCRWATHREQCVNKRTNRYIEFNGETLAMSQWADRLHLPYMTLFHRLKRGMPLERALQSKVYSRWNPQG